MTDFTKTIQEKVAELTGLYKETIAALEAEIESLKAKPEPTPQPAPQWRDARPEDMFPVVEGRVSDDGNKWHGMCIMGKLGPWRAVSQNGITASWRYAQVPANYERPMTVEELEAVVRDLGGMTITPSQNGGFHVAARKKLYTAPTLSAAIKAAVAAKERKTFLVEKLRGENAAFGIATQKEPRQ